MRLKLMAGVFGIVSAAILAAGCSFADGTPSPTGSPPSSTGDGMADQGAPKVKTPIDTSRFQLAPCAALTAAQVQRFTITKPGNADAGTSTLGPGCQWSNTESGTTVGVQFITANPKGLGALYINRDVIVKGGGYFEPAKIQDYPAVFNSSADQRKEGTCALAVAVSDTLDYSVGIALSSFAPRYKDSCGMATEVANLVMTNLRGGS